MDRLAERAAMCLLGTAVGDALGLAREGLSARRAARLFPGEPRPQVLPGFGLISDDTEHACMTAQSFAESGGDLAAFERALARRIRWWFASLPPGIGLATVRACLKLWLGAGPRRSGVRSAGNGPLMRAPIIGVLGRDPAHVRALVDASTRLTHVDDRAIEAARIAAAITHGLSRGEPSDTDLLSAARAERVGAGTESLAAAERALTAGTDGEDVRAFVRRTCGARGEWGVSGYVVHSLGASLYAWRRHRDDARAGMAAIVACGGDTDSTGAFVGALYGAAGCPPPGDWRAGVREWPRSISWIERVATIAASHGRTASIPEIPPGSALLRNIALTAIILVHVGRRALPPY